MNALNQLERSASPGAAREDSQKTQNALPVGSRRCGQPWDRWGLLLRLSVCHKWGIYPGQVIIAGWRGVVKGNFQQSLRLASDSGIASTDLSHSDRSALALINKNRSSVRKAALVSLSRATRYTLSVEPARSSNLFSIAKVRIVVRSQR